MGQNQIFVPECHSTNTLAQECCQQQMVVEGTIVITSSQTAGRGQRGNVWESEAGKNLTFSVVARPVFLAAKDQFQLNIAVSLGISDFLEQKIGADVRIKWPNDILVDGRKICGVLIENTIMGSQLNCSVIGIGLNINQLRFSNPRATSLALVCGQAFDLSDALEDLLVFLEKRYIELRQSKAAAQSVIYRERLFGFNETRLFNASGNAFEGVVKGVDEVGRLIVDTSHGGQTFGMKEIEFVY